MSHWLTIGTPTFDDYYGVLMTLQSLRLHHDLAGVELLVVDQNPGSPQGQATAALCRDIGVRYVPYTARIGTAPGKNAVFANALGEVVMCLDSHVMLAPTALSDLRGLHGSGGVRGLVQGPMLMDNLHTVAVGLTAEWGADVKGKWVLTTRAALDAAPDLTPILSQGGGLYVCRKDEWVGFHPDARGFGGEEWVIQEKFRKAGLPVRLHKGLLWWHRFDWSHKVAGAASHRPYPVLTNDKCRNYLIGFRELGLPADEVRDHFLGTMKLPHEQYHRIAEELGYGGCSACGHQQPAGAAEWSNTPADQSTTFPPLMQPYEYLGDNRLRAWGSVKPGFPDSIRMSLEHDGPPIPVGSRIDLTLDDARAKAEADLTPACGTERADVMYQWYRHIIAQPNDAYAGALVAVNDLAQHSREVYEVADRPGPVTVAILAGHPELLRSRYSHPAAIEGAKIYSDHAAPTTHVVVGTNAPQESPKAEYTLAVVVVTDCNADSVYRLLVEATTGVITKKIVLVGTGDGGNGHYSGESCAGQPGPLPALRRFISENPKWTVVRSCIEGVGALVLSRDPADLPKLPSLLKRAGNFAVSLTMHSLNGGRKVEESEYNRRIELCTLCPFRVDDRCTACGCPVEKKAVWESSECPYGKW